MSLFLLLLALECVVLLFALYWQQPVRRDFDAMYFDVAGLSPAGLLSGCLLSHLRYDSVDWLACYYYFFSFVDEKILGSHLLVERSGWLTDLLALFPRSNFDSARTGRSLDNNLEGNPRLLVSLLVDGQLLLFLSSLFVFLFFRFLLSE